MKIFRFVFLILTACGIREFPGYDVTCEVLRLGYTNLVSSSACSNGSNQSGGGTASQGLRVTTYFAWSSQPSFRMSMPTDMVKVGNSFYIVDMANHNIVELSGNHLTVVAGSPGNAQGPVGGDQLGIGTNALFQSPTSLAVNSNGTVLYIGDQLNYKLKKMDLSTKDVTFLAGGSRGKADGLGAAAQFGRFHALYMRGNQIYMADSGNELIRKISSAGLVSTIAGSGATGTADGPALQATFNNPRGIFTAGNGVVYILDSGAGLVRVLKNGQVSTLAGVGYTGPPKDGIGKNAVFKSALAITGDNKGHLYVGDDETLRKIIIATGEVITIAGAAGQSGVVNGSGQKARFSGEIRGLIYDTGTLVLYLLDELTVRKITGI